MKNNFMQIPCLVAGVFIASMHTPLALAEIVPLAAAALVEDATQAPREPTLEDSQLTREEKIKKAKGYYAAGEQYLREGNYSAADDLFRKAQELLGQSPSLVYTVPEASPQVQEIPLARQAWEYSKKRESKNAIAFYLQAIKADAKNPDLYYNLAIEYLKTSQFKEAAGAFTKVIKLNPQDKSAFYNLGVLCEGYLGDPKQALEYYRKYLKLAPNAEDTKEVKSWIQEINRFSE